jgi:hypothetical protein
MAADNPIEHLVADARVVAAQLGIELALNFGGYRSDQVYKFCEQLRQMHCHPGERLPAPAPPPAPPPEPEEFECPVCFTDYPVSMMFNWGCASQHKLCIGEESENCAVGLVTNAIEGGAMPVCAQCPQADEATMDRTRLRNLVGPQSDLWSKFRAMELGEYINEDRERMVPCPGINCTNYLHNDNPAAKVEVRCDQEGGCGASFCSLCKEMYHRGNTTCEQARQITTNWLDWIAHGRAQYAAQLGHEAAQANAAAQAEAAMRLRNLQQDEEYK